MPVEEITVNAMSAQHREISTPLGSIPETNVVGQDGTPVDFSGLAALAALGQPLEDLATALEGFSMGAVTVVDGGNVAEGAKADVAVQGDTAGTISAKLRGLNEALGTNADASTVASVLGYLAYLKANIPTVSDGAMPVSLPTATVTSLTPPAAITGFALETGGNLATIVTNTGHIPSSPATEGGNLATIATNTGHIPSSPATESGNLATIATNTGHIPSSPSQDGTDSTDANASQATNGVGIRGWLSTLVSLFRAGTAKVTTSAGPAIIPAPTAMHTSDTGTGAGTVLPCTGYATALLVVSGISGDTITTQGTIGGVTSSVYCQQLGTPNAAATTITADGIYVVSCAAFTSITANITNHSAGSITVTGVVSPAGGAGSGSSGGGGGGGAVTVTSGAVDTDSARGTPIACWSNISSAHKLAAVVAITPTGVAGGSLAPGTTYYYAITPYNVFGCGTPLLGSFAPGGSFTAEQLAFAQVTGALGYHVHFGTDSGNPKWAGTFTEAQRAAGCVVTAMGTVGAGGTAGSVTVNISSTLGTPVLTSPFTANNAYTPAALTFVDGANKSSVRFYLTFTPTNIWTVANGLPTLTVIPCSLNQSSAYCFGQPLAVSLAGGTGQPYQVEIVVPVNGGKAMLLIDKITNGSATLTAEVA
jgi:hypothetical protein